MLAEPSERMELARLWVPVALAPEAEGEAVGEPLELSVETTESLPLAVGVAVAAELVSVPVGPAAPPAVAPPSVLELVAEAEDDEADDDDEAVLVASGASGRGMLMYPTAGPATVLSSVTVVLEVVMTA